MLYLTVKPSYYKVSSVLEFEGQVFKNPTRSELIPMLKLVKSLYGNANLRFSLVTETMDIFYWISWNLTHSDVAQSISDIKNSSLAITGECSYFSVISMGILGNIAKYSPEVKEMCKQKLNEIVLNSEIWLDRLSRLDRRE